MAPAKAQRAGAAFRLAAAALVAGSSVAQPGNMQFQQGQFGQPGGMGFGMGGMPQGMGFGMGGQPGMGIGGQPGMGMVGQPGMGMVGQPGMGMVGQPGMGMGGPGMGMGMGSPQGMGMAFGGQPGMGRAMGGQPGAGMGMGFGGQPGMGMGTGIGMGFGGAAFGGMNGMASGNGFQQQQQAQAAPAEVDLACFAGPRAGAWTSTRNRFRSLFAEPVGSPLQMPPQEAITAAVQGAMADLQAVNAFGPDAADECGLGKLCLQLLSFATIDDPAILAQMFVGLEQLASPVLTMLLDVPLALLAQSGWPLPALLSAINLRKATVPEVLNSPEIDGLADESGQLFYAELVNALQTGDANALNYAGGSYLARESKGGALAPLTALAAQAIAAPSQQERMAYVDTLQQAFRQVVGNGIELDMALSTRWPFWALMQMALDGLLG